MTPNAVIQLPPVTTYQAEAIFCDERNAIIEATTKAGKTLGCILWLLSESLNAPKAGREYWWTAPVYEQTKMAHRRTKGLLRETDPDGSIWKSNDTDPSITLANGSVIRFKTAEKPDNLFGEDVYAAVMDEVTRCREEAWHAVRTTLTATQGKARLIGNLKGRKNWAYRLARRVESGGLPDWKYGKITAYDAVRAGIIAPEEVEAAKRELPEAVFKELYEAEPSEDGANPFGLSHIAACVGPMSDGPPHVFGVDLAKSVDFTVVLGLDQQGRPCRFERWQHLPWEATEQRILAIVGSTPTLADSTGVGDPIVEALARRSPNIEGFKFTMTSRQQLMEGLAFDLQKRRVGVLEGVMRSELESFEYEATRTGVRYAAPEGLHDDCAVALALAAQRARHFCEVAISIVSAVATGPSDAGIREGETIPQYIKRRREDPEWGWENVARWN